MSPKGGKTLTGSVIWKGILLFGAVAVALVAGLSVAESQQPAKAAFRILELNPGAPQEQQKVFRQALRELGYVQGQNLLIEDRFATGSDDRLQEYAAEAAHLKVDVIVAISSAAIRAATTATKTIPVVGLDLESDPVASGLIASLSRPGGNLTGVFVDLPGLTGKGLELLKEAMPGIARIAVLRDPTLSPTLLPAAKAAARSLGLQLQVVEARAPNEHDRAFKVALSGGNNALMILPSPRFDRKMLNTGCSRKPPLTSTGSSRARSPASCRCSDLCASRWSSIREPRGHSA